MKKNKILLKILAAAISCLLISTASFAYFTDRASTSATGVAGTLSIEVNSMIEGKEIIIPGKIYNVSPIIKNTGSKSSDIRLVYEFNTNTYYPDEQITMYYNGKQLTDTEGVIDNISYRIENNAWSKIYYFETTLNGSIEKEESIFVDEFTENIELTLDKESLYSDYIELNFQAFAKQHRNTSENSWELIEY